MPLPETEDEGQQFWEASELYLWTGPIETKMMAVDKAYKGKFEGVIEAATKEPVFGVFIYE